VAALDLRLRVPSTELLALPWLQPLGEWDATIVPIRDIPVGPSRHLVRFVEADRAVWALKELPLRIAHREFDVLRAMEDRSLLAVRPAGIVVQPFEDTALLVTRYLDGSWQYRRLLMRLPPGKHKHRERLFDAMAALLVDLHRNGIYWGDCSLANTLFKRDGQRLQAWMVDAETSAVHPSLSDGQRGMDLDILVENVAGGLLDVSARLGEPSEVFEQIADEAEGIRDRYGGLWDLLHDQPTIRLGDRHEVEARLRRLNDLGFAVNEVRLVATDPGAETLRLEFGVAERDFHAEQLRSLTGLGVGEGQATILLNDLRAYQAHLQQLQQEADDPVAARRWLSEVFHPGMALAEEAMGGVGDPIQAYCDLLEVRWLLSEQAGHDVGEAPALEAIAARTAPAESAAEMAVADAATHQLPALTKERIAALGLDDD
jgi:tRNA A-37 threonylcarbamoyl transferase component Bud32